MARHRVLPIAAPFQIGALGEEAHGGPALLPRQTARRGRLWAFPRRAHQGKACRIFSPSLSAFYPEIITRDNKQARSNKIANKSESDLAEFEAVRFPILLLARRLLISHIMFSSFFWDWIGPKGEPKTRRRRPGVRKARGGQESSGQETRHAKKCAFLFFSYWQYYLIDEPAFLKLYSGKKETG
jgi:hypothetical protein